MSCRDELFSTTLYFEIFNNNEEIDNRLDELVDDEFDEYKSYSFNGGEGRMERSSFGSLGEWRNEEGNEEKKRNKMKKEIKKGTHTFQQMVGVLGKLLIVTLLIQMFGSSLQVDMW